MLTILIHFSHIDIFKAVHEGHINRSKIGNALISGIVAVFVTHTCIFFFFPVFELLSFSLFVSFFFFFLECPNKQTNEKVNLIYFDNAMVIHELIQVELYKFCTFDAVDALNKICSTY